MKVLIELPTWLGDTVMATPAIENLTGHFNEPEITLIGSGISIEISNIRTYTSKKNVVRITFTQRFKSSKYSDIGLKELFWEKDDNGWKIIKETWKPR